VSSIENDLKKIIRKRPPVLEILLHAIALGEFTMPQLAEECGNVKTAVVRRYSRYLMKMNIIYRKAEGIYALNEFLKDQIEKFVKNMGIIAHTRKYLLINGGQYYTLIVNRRKGFAVKTIDKKVITVIIKNADTLPRWFSVRHVYEKLKIPIKLASLALRVMFIMGILERSTIDGMKVYKFKK